MTAPVRFVLFMSLLLASILTCMFCGAGQHPCPTKHTSSPFSWGVQQWCWWKKFDESRFRLSSGGPSVWVPGVSLASHRIIDWSICHDFRWLKVDVCSNAWYGWDMALERSIVEVIQAGQSDDACLRGVSTAISSWLQSFVGVTLVNEWTMLKSWNIPCNSYLLLHYMQTVWTQDVLWQAQFYGQMPSMWYSHCLGWFQCSYCHRESWLQVMCLSPWLLYHKWKWLNPPELCEIQAENCWLLVLEKQVIQTLLLDLV